MKKDYLLPILSFVLLAIVILVLVKFEYDLTPLLVGLMIAVYLAINIIYGVAKKTFHVSILVELGLISLIAFYVLTNLL